MPCTVKYGQANTVEKRPIFLSGNGEKNFIDNITPLIRGARGGRGYAGYGQRLLGNSARIPIVFCREMVKKTSLII